MNESGDGSNSNDDDGNESSANRQRTSMNRLLNNFMRMCRLVLIQFGLGINRFWQLLLILLNHEPSDIIVPIFMLFAFLIIIMNTPLNVENTEQDDQDIAEEGIQSEEVDNQTDDIVVFEINTHTYRDNVEEISETFSLEIPCFLFGQTEVVFSDENNYDAEDGNGAYDNNDENFIFNDLIDTNDDYDEDDDNDDRMSIITHITDYMTSEDEDECDTRDENDSLDDSHEQEISTELQYNAQVEQSISSTEQLIPSTLLADTTSNPSLIIEINDNALNMIENQETMSSSDPRNNENDHLIPTDIPEDIHQNINVNVDDGEIDLVTHVVNEQNDQPDTDNNQDQEVLNDEVLSSTIPHNPQLNEPSINIEQITTQILRSGARLEQQSLQDEQKADNEDVQEAAHQTIIQL